MEKINFLKELKIAREAALSAGKFLITNKSDLKKKLLSTSRDIKLKADIAAENIIKEILLRESSYSILAEESVSSIDKLPDIFWVVDPLDGTANFQRDIPICCVSIALISKSIPIIGVIYDFNNDDLYEGSVRSKALLNKNIINVSNTESHSNGILLTGLPNDTDYSSEALNNMIENFQNWRKVRMIGSAAIASVYVASGKADFYMENKSYLWDIAAGAAIVNAAGGKALILNQNEKFQVDVRFSNSLVKI